MLIRKFPRTHIEMFWEEKTEHTNFSVCMQLKKNHIAEMRKRESFEYEIE